MSLRRGRRAPFAQVPEDLLFDPSLSSHAKVIWGILARRIDHRDGSETEGLAFPGREWLASKLSSGKGEGVSLDTIDRALAQLRERGWIEVERQGKGLPNAYTVHDWLLGGVRTGADSGVGTGADSVAAQVRTPNKESKNQSKNNHTETASPEEDSPPSSSSRRSTSTRASSGRRDSRLTPGPTAPPTPPPADLALAERLFNSAERPLARNVRTLRPVIADLLAAGFTPEAIERAALAPACCAWTYAALAFGIRQAETEPYRRPGSRPPRPAPPVVVAEERGPGLTEAERAYVHERNAEIRAQIRERTAREVG